MPLPTTFTENEISLGGYRLPIKGRIQVTLVNHFPSKITMGKSSRSDQVVADEWIMDDWREGLLINQLEEQVHKGRFWWSTLGTHMKKKLVLAPRVVSIGTPSGVTADCELLVEYNGFIYASFNGYIYRWDGNQWSESLISPSGMGSVAIDAIEYNNVLYISYGTGYYYSSNGTSFTNNTTDVSYFALFDSTPTQKLAAIDSTGLIKVSANGTTWDSATVGGQVYDAVINGLVVFRNTNDEPTLMVSTDRGLYSVDVWTKATYLTSLQTTVDDNAGKGALVWNDGNLYFPHRKAIWRYPKMGQISNMGLDRDDGLPIFLKGHVVKLIKHPNFIVALMNAAVFQALVDEEPQLGMEFNMPAIHTQASTATYSAVLGWDGGGWHIFYISSTAATNISSGLFTTYFGDETRVYFAEDAVVSYVVMPEGNYDPLQDESAEFQTSGDLITSWFDGDYSEILKLGTSLKLRTKNVTNTETITISYQINDTGSDSSPSYSSGWNQLAVISTSDAAGTVSSASATAPHTVTFTPSTGISTITINPPNGLQFYSIRLKFTFAGVGGNSTPALLFFDLRHKKLPDILWGYTLTVSGVDNERLQDIWNSVRTLVDNKQTIRFGYRDIEEESKIVLVSSVSGIRYAGSADESYFTLTLIELEA